MSAEPDETRWVPVGEVGEVRVGKQLSPASSQADGRHAPYLRVANVLDGRIDYSDVKTMSFSSLERKRYELLPGDILLNEGQSLELVGRSSIYDGPPGGYFFQNTLVRFRSGPNVLPAYAREIFRAWLNDGTFASIAKKTTSIAHLGGDRFARLPFPLVPMSRQRRIVEILDSVSESERAAQAAIAKIRAVRSGITLSRMASVVCGEVPTGWERMALREVVPSADYGISVALDEDSRGIPTLRMNNLLNGRIELGEVRYCPRGVQPENLLRVGDVLFNRTNSIEHVGKSAMWGGELEEATFASYLVRLNPDIARINPGYLVEWLQHPEIRRRVRSIATVAVQQVNVNPTKLRDLLIDFPTDLREQAGIIASLEACDRRIAVERESLAKVRAVKQGISDVLLNSGPGKLDRLMKATETGVL
ncbi:restriction endonuclease subunit S [Streptomyces sp. NBC_00876]|uniref:restriction endonuclease subunit S n=1 Tax=Streptomyces sp. NBC_00876 TaxID=2975853 RepID=UPI00386F6E53|nr:restriction endonuclease subunit S [Streptomyces sp. NBC_00876]